MDGRVWTQILATYRDIDALLDRAFVDPLVSPDLDALRKIVRQKFDTLRLALVPLVPLNSGESPERHGERIIEVLVPLLFLVDERVLVRLGELGDGRELAWHSLQRDLFPAEDGGDVFFERVAALFQRTDAEALLFEVYLFCLQEGFEGRHGDDPAALARWRERLAEKVPVPPPPATPPPVAAPPATAQTSRLVLVTAAAVVAMCAILFAVAASM